MVGVRGDHIKDAEGGGLTVRYVKGGGADCRCCERGVVQMMLGEWCRLQMMLKGVVQTADDVKGGGADCR